MENDKLPSLIIDAYANKPMQEQDLFKILDRLEAALKGANEGIWDWNLDDNTIYYSSTLGKNAWL